ncbi:MAG: hypothetical protein RLZZ347_532 [Candidatus Parcubacteria bacterium]|jgi:competence protein ComEC
MVYQVDTVTREALRTKLTHKFLFQNRIIQYSLAGFILGVASASLFSFGLAGSGVISLLALLILFYGEVDTRAHKEYTRLIFWLLLFCAIGVGRVAILEHTARHNLDPFVGTRVSVSGVVVGEPDIRDDARKLTVLVDTISDNHGTAKYSGKVLVSSTLYPTVAYGDRVQVRGALSYPRIFESQAQTGRVFNYPAYLAKDDIFYTMDRAGVSVVGHDEGNWVQARLFALKHYFVSTIDQILSEPYASLLSGLLLGGKQSLGKELLDQFKTVGLIHIVVLSGYNITLVGDVILKLFSFLPRFFSMSLSVTTIILFALMTGAGATVVRASAMALIALYARTHGKMYDMTRALLFAGFVMVFHNPAILLFDTSFQLSFLATLGLILLSPIFKEKLSFLPERFQFREIVASTLATQAFVLPLILYNTGALAVLSLPANLLVLPTIPATMLSGFVATVTAFASPIVALPFTGVASLLLHYQVGLVRLIASIPFASVTIPAFPVGVLVIAYCVLGGWIFWIRTNTRQASDVEL